MPRVTFDATRRQAWEHGKKEIKFFMEQVDYQLDPGLGTDKFDTSVGLRASLDRHKRFTCEQVLGMATHSEST